MEKLESCVNLTTIWGVTKHSKTVRVEAWDRSGNEIALKLTGWAAALLQHEIDHSNGRLFIDRLKDSTKADPVEPRMFEDYRKDKATWPKKK